MVKYLKNYWLLFFALGCNKNENFVEGQILKKKTIGLNKDIIEKYTTLSTTRLNLSGTNEIAHCGTQSVLKMSDDKFLLVDNISAKSFNLSQIKIDSIGPTENIKSFFYLKNELYVCTADGGILSIYKCEEKVGNQQKNGNDDFLPIKEFSLTEQCKFNPNDNKNCFDKVKYSILRRLNKSHPNTHYKLSQISEVDIITFDSGSLISCCSNCVVRNNQVIKEGCFFILPCNLDVNCFSISGGNTESVSINMGLFFDGEKIVPCLEGESDSSFLNGTFSDFSINAIKGFENKIACKSMLKKNDGNSVNPVKKASDQSNDLDDFINVGELFLDSENNIRYRLIVSKRVDKLKNFTFLSTKNKEAIVSTVYVDESDNKVKFGRLIENDFSAQCVVGLQGIDLYKTKAAMPTRTRLRDYNMVFIGNNNLLLQYNNPNGSDDCDYLLALNELEIPVCS